MKMGMKKRGARIVVRIPRAAARGKSRVNWMMVRELLYFVECFRHAGGWVMTEARRESGLAQSVSLFARHDSAS